MLPHEEPRTARPIADSSYTSVQSAFPSRSSKFIPCSPTFKVKGRKVIFGTAHGTSALISVRGSSIFAHMQRSTPLVEDFDERRTANQRCNTGEANEGVADASHLPFDREGLPCT